MALCPSGQHLAACMVRSQEGEATAEPVLLAGKSSFPTSDLVITEEPFSI